MTNYKKNDNVSHVDNPSQFSHNLTTLCHELQDR